MKKSLFVLFLYSSLLTASEIAYRFVFGIETLPAAKMAETFALTFMIAALYLFARYKASRLLIAVFFAFSIIANNVHYAVYQSWMTGINYWLMLKEITEVGSAGASMLDKLWLPALWGVLEVMLFCSLAKFRRKTHFSADILFAFLMLMIFVRSFDTKQEHGISPKPTYSRIKANYFSFGYFVGRVLPYQLFDLSKIPVFKQSAPSKIGQGSVQNIVLIMGESESAAHLKLFGYGRETSPFLTQLSQADFKPIVKQSYSAGFMTPVSLTSYRMPTAWNKSAAAIPICSASPKSRAMRRIFTVLRLKTKWQF